MEYIDNVATSNGGGIITYLGKIEIDTCEFSNNKAEYGGGIHADNLNFTMVNSKLSSNIASYGGGLYNRESQYAMITNSLFIQNEALDNGGAALMYNFSNLKFFNCDFISNSADNDGGALYLYDNADVTIVDSLFDDNTAIYGSCFNLILNSKLYSENTEFKNNMADYGQIGSIRGDSAQTVTLVNSIMSNNKGRISNDIIYEEFPQLNKISID